MAVLDVADNATPLSGKTWLLTTPEDMDPALLFYFTYIEGKIVLQSVHEQR
jgi:hypothetical protein